MIWQTQWLGIGLVYAALGLLFLILQWGRVRRRFSPEVRRKALHVVMGLVTLSFPWLFDHWWPVVFLAVTTLIALLVIRCSPSLSKGIGSALHDVKRSGSYGEFFFPVGVLFLYLLGSRDLLLYMIPLMTLTFADAAAALVGQHYGRRFYTLLGDRRSLEGSTAFFGTTFACTLTVLLWASGLSGIETGVISFIFALTMTLVEAFSWDGLDNLLLPVCGFFVLGFLQLGSSALV